MKKMLTVIAALAVLALLLQIAALPAFAAEDGMYEYEVADGGAVITGYLGSGAEKIELPSSLGGYPVVGVGDNAFGKVGSDGVKPHAEITQVSVPASIVSFGDRAFNGTSWIDSPAAADKNGFVVLNGVLVNYIGDAKAVSVPDTAKNVGIAAFEKNEIESVVIPDSVTVIDDYAFYKCTALKSVVIGKNVTEIGKSAFYDCTALEKLAGKSESVMYDKLRTVGANAFFDCASLSGTVDLGMGLEDLGANAFANCKQLNGVRVPDTLKSIGSYAMGFRMTKTADGYRPDQDVLFTIYVSHRAKADPAAEQEVLASYSKTGAVAYKYAQNPDGNGYFRSIHLVWDRLGYPFAYGDVNNDGKVNSADARTAMRHAASLDRLEHEDDLKAADVNFDGKVNSKDARAILRAVARIEPLKIPAEEA